MVNIRLLKAEEIECRIASVNQWGIQLLLYKDARCDMNILDEIVGAFNWQRKHELINGNLFCSVGILNDGQWVWKQDVGVESYTEKEKGQASDAFKRACFNWGIGRELYTAPVMFINARDLKTLKQDDKGKWTCRDYFTVEEITYSGRKIATVRVLNQKTGQDHEFGTPATAMAMIDETKRSTIGKIKAKALETLCSQKGVAVQKLYDRYKVTRLEDLTEEQHASAVRSLEKS